MKKDIFKKRVNIKPYEYPELLKFKDAIRHSNWLHTEFNITSDIQDFKTRITQEEREVLTRAMLAISQIEINVKRFWGNLYNYFPKSEIDDVGGVFSANEILHKDAYSFLLENLGLNDEFEMIHNIPAIIDRINYLEEFLTVHNNKKGIVLSLILFSLFVEHVSLFGQFFIIMSFNKKKNLFKGVSNIVEATSKEEELHGKFGMTLYKIIKKERPELFDKHFKFDLSIQIQKALKAEIKILDWIYEKGDLDFVPKDMVINYVANRLMKSSKFLDVDLEIIINKKLLEQTKWFDIEILSTKDNDFFYKRSIDYSKKHTNITEDDLF